MYKLVLLDLDGTTVASKQDALPSQRVIDAVKTAGSRVTVAIATGRPYKMASSIIQTLGLSGPGVFNGGAEIVDMATGEILKSELLSIETQRELAKLSAPFGYQIYTDKNQYEVPILSEDDVQEPTAKLFLEGVRTDEAIAILEQLNGVPNAVAHPTSSWVDGDVVDIHITHEHASKRHGAEALMDLLGINKEEVIAIGDGHNDIPLLEAAGLKVAMGNAPDEVKAIADHVTTSYDQDGVAVAIEKFVLDAGQAPDSSSP